MADDLAWRRFWSPRDASPLLENGGYLVDPEDSWLRRHTQLRELSRLRDIPCLILLGEPGMGKSYTLARTARDQSWVPPGAAVLSVDLRYQRLDPDLLDAPEYKDYLDGAHELHLFIDSLDESLAENATATLIRILARHPVHRLRLRVACRTGAVPHTLETELRRIWRDSGKTDMDVQIYELAPLRAVDVRLAAARGGVDTDAFLAALKPHRAELFAARPITLLCFLLPMFKAQRKLPERRWDLFEAGCRLLCDDPSASRHAAHTSGGQTASERMMIASRMAAAYILGRRNFLARSSLHRRPAGGDVPAGSYADVALDELTGVETIADSEFPVTIAALQEVVEHTHLFTAYGPWHLVWNHRSFAEFLTARFLIARRLDDDDLSDLLFPSPGAGVPMELREVAAWLLPARPRLAAEAFKRDLSMTLHGDLRSFSEAQRAALVDAMLDQADLRNFADDERILHQAYVDIRHTGLAGQLEPWIRGSHRFTIARRIAIHLADTCREITLSDALLDLAMNEDEDVHLRALAARALKHVARPQQMAALRSLLGSSSAHDPQDELLGNVLFTLWPDHLGVPELLTHLHTARDPSRTGNYEHFLAKELVPCLGDADIPLILDWMTAHPQDVEQDTGLASCCNALWQRAWDALQDPAVTVALARYAHGCIATHTKLVPRDVWQGDDPRVNYDPPGRRRFLRAIAALIRPIEAFTAAAVLGHHGLLPTDETAWLIAQLGHPNSTPVTFWVEALAYVARRLPQDGHDWSRVVDAVDQHPALKQALDHILGAVPIAGEQAERLRLTWKEEQERLADLAFRLDPPPEHRVLTSLESLEDGHSSRLDHLHRDLSLRVDSRSYDPSRVNLMEMPGWQSADDALRIRIRGVHKQYLLQAMTSPPHDGAAIHRDTLTACRALYLLLAVEPDWLGGVRDGLPPRPHTRGQAFWAKWIPALVAEASQPQDLVDRPAMLQLAYRGNPACFLESLEERLRQGENFNCRYLDDAWDPGLAALLLRVVADPATSIYILRSTVDILAHHREPALPALLHTLVPLPPPTAATPRLRAQTAAWALFLADTQRAWPHLAAVFQADLQFGREFLDDRGLSLSDAIRSWYSVSSQYLVEIYRWLVRTFPEPAPRTRPRRLGAFSSYDTARFARGAIRDLLVARDLDEFDESMNNLLATDPTLHEVALARLEASRRHAQSSWRSLEPRQVLALRVRWRRCFDPRSPSEERDSQRAAFKLLLHVFEDVKVMRRWFTTLPSADAVRRECPQEDGVLASLAEKFVDYMYRTKDDSWIPALAPHAYRDDIEWLALRWLESPGS